MTYINLQNHFFALQKQLLNNYWRYTQLITDQLINCLHVCGPEALNSKSHIKSVGFFNMVKPKHEENF